uniref:Uncharacterized protein n=1 Tax=Siphoviridae sp. cthrG7 TaxID=2826428 RepID=A0A8S5MBW3_9CAUD|nr:MAG TPA: hypothetical protein [Siphoviridae sp. cthrG7]
MKVFISQRLLRKFLKSEAGESLNTMQPYMMRS